MPRSAKATSGNAACLNAVKPPPPPASATFQNEPYWLTPLRPAWSAIGTPASAMSPQTLSNLG